jgi:hypothetical protein
MKLGKSTLVAAAVVATLAPTSANADPVPPPAPPHASDDQALPAQHATSRERAAESVPQPTPPPSAVPAPTPEEIRRRRVDVRIDATRPDTILERRTSVKEELGAFIVLPFRSTQATWEQVCVTPCNVDLDRFSTYRISPQNGISESSQFTLPQKADVLHLNVGSGSLLAHRVGQGLGVIGVSALIVGVSLIAAASDFKHPSDARVAGGITGGSGLALSAVGLPLAFLSKSRVSTDGDNRAIANIYHNRGYAIPFLPDIKLSKSLTLTQRGIAF